MEELARESPSLFGEENCVLQVFKGNLHFCVQSEMISEFQNKCPVSSLNMSCVKCHDVMYLPTMH